MFRLCKNSILIFILLLGCNLNSYSKAAAPVYLRSVEYIQLQSASVQNTIPSGEENNVVLCRSHNGIDESSAHFSQHNKKAQTANSDIRCVLYESSHYVCYLLSLNHKNARRLNFTFACSLRAPPTVLI